MNGTVPGNTMLVNIFVRDAEKLFAMARKRASLVFTPDSALMTMGITAPRNTTATFDQMPMPNQMMSSGSKVTRGTALSVSTNGLTMYDMRRDHPIKSPSGTPTAAAAAYPQMNSLALTRASFQKS